MADTPGMGRLRERSSCDLNTARTGAGLIVAWFGALAIAFLRP